MGVAWPAQLQDLANEEGFAYTPGETVLRTDMEIGPQKMRRRFTKSVDEMSLTLRLDTTQYGVFLNFYNISTNAGTLPFNFNHPITGDAEEWRFLDVPSFRSIGGGYFMVGMRWEKVP